MNNLLQKVKSEHSNYENVEFQNGRNELENVNTDFNIFNQSENVKFKGKRNGLAKRN